MQLNVKALSVIDWKLLLTIPKFRIGPHMNLTELLREIAEVISCHSISLHMRIPLLL